MAPNSQGTSSEAAEVDRILMWTVLAVLATMPLTTTFILWSAPGGENHPFQSVALRPVDFVLVVLVTVCGADVIERRSGGFRKRWPIPVALFALTMTWFLVAFAVHPSWRGVEWFLRVAATWAIAYAIYRIAPRRQQLTLTALVSFAAVQAALAVAQYFRGGAVGLPAVEWNVNWQRVGGATFGRGSFDNSYQLAALLVTSVGAAALLLRKNDWRHGRTLLHGFFFLAGVGVALTFSRTVYFSLLPIAGLLLARRASRPAAGLLLAGVALGVVAGLGGHATKAAQVTDPNRIDSGRLSHAEDAALLVASEPVVGVGPGRYVIALRDVDYSFILAPPHNVAAHAAAEAGIPGGILTVSALAAFGWWLLRRGTLAVVAGLALAPFFLLDVFPYAAPAGLVLSGFWLGVVCVAIDTERSRLTTPAERDQELPVPGRTTPLKSWSPAR